MTDAGGKWVCREKSKCKTGQESRDSRAEAPKSRSPSLRPQSPPHAMRRRRSWSPRRLSFFISGLGRGHDTLPGFQKDGTGAFSLEDLMDCWGKEQGLSTARVLKDSRRGPILRFALDQGPNDDDPIFIRVAHSSRA